MAKPQLETLRELLRDTRAWVSLGIVLESAPASDGSVWRAKVQLLPNNNEVIARVARGSVGPLAGLHGPVSPRDMCVVVIPEGDEDSSVIVGFLPTQEDKIPAHARAGDTVVQSLAQKKLVLASLQQVLIGLGDLDDPATENLVLGQVLKDALSTVLQTLMDLCDTLATHTHVGNFGAPTSAPIEATDFTDHKDAFEAVKLSPVDDEAMLSDIAFTEKGA